MDRVPVMLFCESTGISVGQPNLSAETRFTLQGKHAMARGLGLTIVRGLLEHGIDKVALLDIDKDEGDEAAATLRDSFPHKKDSIIFRVLDVTNAEDVTAVTTEVSERFGGIDVLATFVGIVNSTAVVSVLNSAAV